jgi:hypothetical protein
VPIILFALLLFVLLALAGVVLAFPCLALPRRHRSTASTALGRQPKCLDDQLLGCFLSLLHLLLSFWLDAAFRFALSVWLLEAFSD